MAHLTIIQHVYVWKGTLSWRKGATMYNREFILNKSKDCQFNILSKFCAGDLLSYVNEFITTQMRMLSLQYWEIYDSGDFGNEYGALGRVTQDPLHSRKGPYMSTCLPAYTGELLRTIWKSARAKIPDQPASADWTGVASTCTTIIQWRHLNKGLTSLQPNFQEIRHLIWSTLIRWRNGRELLDTWLARWSLPRRPTTSNMAVSKTS